MKKEILIVISVLTLYSCIDKDKVNVNDINQRIKVGMSKQDLINTFGFPDDSLIWDDSNQRYYYIYKTNDLSGYTLKTIFDSNNNILFYRLD